MTRRASFPDLVVLCAIALVALLGAACEAAPASEGTGTDRGEDVLVAGPGDASADDAGDEATPSRPAGDALVEWLNGLRADLDLEPVERSEALGQAARAHASFLGRHGATYASQGLSAHAEVAGLEGFTGATFMERLDHFGYDGRALAEVIAFKPSALAAGRSWLESLYHRLPLLHPGAREVGYGEAGEDGRWANVLELGTLDGLDAGTRRIVWPPAGATDVPAAWDGAEIPQPAAPPGGYPSGPVITAQVARGALDLGVAIVAPEGSKVPVPATVLTAANDPALPGHAVAVIPHEPLAAETTYHVTLAGTLDGVPFEESWAFSTRREGCDTLLQDCTDGRGCYLLGDGPACLWSGAGTSGQTCTHVNECAAGLTCVGSRCRPLCNANAQGGPSSCVEQCAHGSIPLSDTGPEGACLPPSCALQPGLCGSAEGCYWVGSFVCDWAGAAAAGETCSYANDCAPGQGCLGVEGIYTCRVLCDGPGLPDCAHVCAGKVQQLDPESGVRFCL